VLQRTAEADIPYPTQDTKAYRIPFVNIKLLHLIRDILRIELDRRVNMANALNPLSQNTLRPIGIIVSPDIKHDR
jgi:hypothetical protein